MILLCALYLLFLSNSVLSIEQPCHVVIGSNTISSDSVYNVAILSCSPGRLNLRATIVKNNTNIAYSIIVLPSEGIYIIPIKIPKLDYGELYYLKVQGDLVGSNLHFNYEQNLQFNSKQAIILIETNRAIYRANQNVLFRIVILKKDLLPYSDAVDVFIKDADGFIMRRWLSMYANNGIISLQYVLPKYVKEGFWKIKVILNNQIEEQKFKVENFYDPLFDVYINTAVYHSVENKEFKGNIFSMKVSEEIVRSNASVFLSVRNSEHSDFNILHTIRTTISEKNWELKFPIEPKLGQEYKLEAALTELLSGETEYGFAITKIVSDDIRLRFLHDTGVFLFEPNFPFITQISAEYLDGRNLPESLLEKSEIRLNLSYQNDSNQSWSDYIHQITIYPSHYFDDYILLTDENFDDFLKFGVLNLLIRPPKQSNRLRISASMFIDSQKVASTELYCLCRNKYMMEASSIKVSSSTYTPTLGDFAIFHVHSGFKISKLYYLTASNGNCRTVGALDIHREGVSTLALPISRDNSVPLMTLIVFGITTDGLLVSDSVHLPLSSLHTYQVLS